MAIALIGVGVTATLTAFGQTITGSDRHRSVVAAEAWAQSAGDYLTSDVPRLPCYVPGAATVLPAYYEGYLRAATLNSEGWPTTNLRVVPPVQFWNGVSFGSDAGSCREALGQNGLKAQLVTIEVTSPDGKVTRTLTVVKGP